MFHKPVRIGAVGHAPWARRALAAVAAVLMGMPGAAYPISLADLLRLPLEDLLRLKISGHAPAPHGRSGAPTRLPLTPERGNT